MKTDKQIQKERLDLYYAGLIESGTREELVWALKSVVNPLKRRCTLRELQAWYENLPKLPMTIITAKEEK
jgi:hypothetical protein